MTKEKEQGKILAPLSNYFCFVSFVGSVCRDNAYVSRHQPNPTILEFCFCSPSYLPPRWLRVCLCFNFTTIFSKNILVNVGKQTRCRSCFIGGIISDELKQNHAYYFLDFLTISHCLEKEKKNFSCFFSRLFYLIFSP